MRRYQKWMSVGLLALTPGVTLAGALNSPQLMQSTSANASASKTADKSKGPTNQKLANEIASALRKARLSGYEIEIDVRNGIATLDGMVGTAAQRERDVLLYRRAELQRVQAPKPISRSSSSATRPHRSDTIAAQRVLSRKIDQPRSCHPSSE